MAKTRVRSCKLLATRDGQMLLVRRRKDGAWTLPGGKRKSSRESAQACLQRELSEELPELRIVLEKDARKSVAMIDRERAIFVAAEVCGSLTIGDRRELDRAQWRDPWSVRLTAGARRARDAFFLRQPAFAGRAGP